MQIKWMFDFVVYIENGKMSMRRIQIIGNLNGISGPLSFA